MLRWSRLFGVLPFRHTGPRSSRSGKKVRRAVCKQLHGCVGNTRAIPGSGCVAQGRRGKPKSAAIQPKHGHVDPDVETETLEALPHPRARYSTVFPILLRHGAQCCVPFSLPLPPATCRPRSHCAGAVPLQAAENLRGFQGARVSFRGARPARKLPVLQASRSRSGGWRLLPQNFRPLHATNSSQTRALAALRSPPQRPLSMCLSGTFAQVTRVLGGSCRSFRVSLLKHGRT